jgi:hypothetical protein
MRETPPGQTSSEGDAAGTRCGTAGPRSLVGNGSPLGICSRGQYFGERLLKGMLHYEEKTGEDATATGTVRTGTLAKMSENVRDETLMEKNMRVSDDNTTNVCATKAYYALRSARREQCTKSGHALHTCDHHRVRGPRSRAGILYFRDKTNGEDVTATATLAKMSEIACDETLVKKSMAR